MRMTALRALALAAMLAPATAGAVCNVLGVNLSFGPYDPLSPAGTAVSGTITVACDQSPAPTATIMIGPSLVSGSMNPRRMRLVGGTDVLDYNLYVDAQLGTVWGDGMGGTAVRSDRVQKSKPWTVTVYGRVPGSQDVTVGNYSDSIAITINF